MTEVEQLPPVVAAFRRAVAERCAGLRDVAVAQWLDLTDVPAVLTDVVGSCAAVLAGRPRIRRDGRRGHLDLQAADGRRSTLPGGHDSRRPWRRPVRDGGLPGQGL